MNDSPQKTTDTKLKRWAKNLAAFGTRCIIFLVIGEMAARGKDLLPKPLPLASAGNFRLASNPIIRFEFKPGYGPDQEQYEATSAGFQINSSGFRDREFDLQKPENTRRIIVLGDSITAGNGMPDVEKIYSKRLEALLNETPGAYRTEVFNMAVTGYNTLQEVETLREKGMVYDPDIVIVGFCVINDFSWGNSIYDRLMEQLDPTQRKLLGDLQYENRAWLNAVTRRSRLAMFINRQVQARRGEQERVFETADGYALRGRDPVSMALPILSGLQKAHGFECFIFIIPVFDDVFNRYGYGHIHDRLRTVAAAYPNIRIVDLFEDFANSNEHPNDLTIDGAHLTAKGHDMLARFIKRFVETPELAKRAAPDLKRFLIKNSSFEVFHLESLRPVTWHASPGGSMTHPDTVRADPAAPNGSHAVELHGVENVWAALWQELDMIPDDYGKTVVASAYGKTPAGRNMWLEIEYRIGEERYTERTPWPASPDEYTRVEVRLVIPREAAGNFNRIKVSIRPGSGARYFLDEVVAHVE